ncbi:hypothetical protein SRABI118_02408 [Massilia sp. Bi118]|uniref:hypothetical protein n=1 Tax=Massilia sp. Bi118 TaxID=2822346 RepID=UPI001E1A87EC|nr:hypothetical protein [Massilia sp. Bi118]CAH0228591.1 hypothetical protein SRABI118_02408 [Massilia sp. Bi118]
MDEQEQERNSKTIEQRIAAVEDWLALITDQKFPGTRDLEGFKRKLAELAQFKNRNAIDS